MSDKPRAKCPTLRRTATRQISGGAGLVFKGSGFYITDYGKDGKGPRKDASPRASPASSSTGGEKSGSEKPSSEQSTSEKPATPTASEKPAEKGTKAKSSSKKAKE